MSDQPGARIAAASDNPHSHAKHPRRRRHRKKLPSGKAIAWAGGIVSSAIVAFVAAFATVLGTNAASPAAAPPMAGGPVQVTVGNVSGADPNMALPGPVALSAEQLARLGTDADLPGSASYAWFSAHDAAFVGEADIELVVQGNRRDQARIINIFPVEQCSAPLDGTMFFAPGQSGQDLSAHLFLNLDTPQVPASYMPPSSGKEQPNYFGQYSISLALGEQFTFQVAVSAHRQYCAFTLDLVVVDSGKTVVEPVSDNGKPFRVTPLPPRGSNGKLIFSRYQDLYLGGVAAPGETGLNVDGALLWARGNPKTFTW